MTEADPINSAARAVLEALAEAAIRDELYAAAPDSEGTPGGLVSPGRRDRLGSLVDTVTGAHTGFLH